MNAFFYQADLSQSLGELSAEESKHCARVLRKKPGDTITLTDGRGTLCQAKLIQVNPSGCTYQVISNEQIPRPDYRIQLAVSPTKHPDRFEWMVEKCTELGVDEITPLLCEHTERQSVNHERLLRICLSAMKQSQRVWLPVITAPQYFTDYLHRVNITGQLFIAYVDSSNPDQLVKAALPAKNYALMIGPEGDFTQEELTLAMAKGALKVSLGGYRLRTETAAVAGCHVLNLINLP
ncbi:MAG: 16S rRNA (uracil(1498)-N(3))-methyltransferase [Cyclobacteriaceae bacterium]|jgi:16S rRNA (uracil1498-N3)-methyltransferase|nr:16S rRNA (uracil(1498)-N(3))-methyltransferase [Cyclobacteriaceae bacterium]